MGKEKDLVIDEDFENIKHYKAKAEALDISLTEYLLYKTYKKVDNMERLIDNIEFHLEEIDKRL